MLSIGLSNTKNAGMVLDNPNSPHPNVIEKNNLF